MYRLGLHLTPPPRSSVSNSAPASYSNSTSVAALKHSRSVPSWYHHRRATHIPIRHTAARHSSSIRRVAMYLAMELW